MPFGTEKLEWFGYPIVKKCWRYVYSFWQNSRTWRSDGRTDTAWRHRPCLHSIARQKRWFSIDQHLALDLMTVSWSVECSQHGVSSFDHAVKFVTADADDNSHTSVDLVYDSKGSTFFISRRVGWRVQRVGYADARADVFIARQHGSICPSIRPSHSGIISKRLIVILSSAYGSSVILVLPVLSLFAKFRRDHFYCGVEYRVGYINFAIFDQYLAICGKRYKIGP